MHAHKQKHRERNIERNKRIQEHRDKIYGINKESRYSKLHHDRIVEKNTREYFKQRRSSSRQQRRRGSRRVVPSENISVVEPSKNIPVVYAIRKNDVIDQLRRETPRRELGPEQPQRQQWEPGQRQLQEPPQQQRQQLQEQQQQQLKLRRFFFKRKPSSSKSKTYSNPRELADARTQENQAAVDRHADTDAQQYMNINTHRSDYKLRESFTPGDSSPPLPPQQSLLQQQPRFNPLRKLITPGEKSFKPGEKSFTPGDSSPPLPPQQATTSRKRRRLRLPGLPDADTFSIIGNLISTQ